MKQSDPNQALHFSVGLSTAILRSVSAVEIVAVGLIIIRVGITGPA